MQDQPTSKEFLEKIFSELADIKKQLSKTVVPVSISPNWISRRDAMQFLSYGDTQMAALEKSGQLVITKIGKRKFIHKDSLATLLDKNIIRHP